MRSEILPFEAKHAAVAARRDRHRVGVDIMQVAHQGAEIGLEGRNSFSFRRHGATPIRHKYEIMVAQKVASYHDARLDMFRQHAADRSEQHSAVGRKDMPHAQNGGQVLIRLPLRLLLEITAQQAGDVFPPDRIGAVLLELKFRWNELTALVKISVDQPPHHDHRGVIAAQIVTKTDKFWAAVGL